MLIGVVAHVNREHLVDKLIREVDVDVIRFDDGLPSVTGCADNHIRVLTELEKRCAGHRWCVVLEDDALPVPGFREQLKMALAQADTQLVGLYLGTGNPSGPTQRAIMPAVKAAKASDSHWIVSDWFLSTVGYAVRSTALSGLIKHVSDDGGPIDCRINEWSHTVGGSWFTQPSLVDHSDETSVIAGPGIPTPLRHAHWVGTRKVWGKSSVKMGYAQPWSPSGYHC